MSLTALFTRPEFRLAEDWFVLDIAEAARIWEFIASSRRWLLPALAFCYYRGLVLDDAVVLRVFTPLLAALVLAITWIRHHPHRDALLAWTFFILVIAAPSTIWCFRAVHE